MFLDELQKAFERMLIFEEHNLRRISKKTGVNNSTVNRLNSKKAEFANLPALTIQRLFPEMKVFFFRSDYPKDMEIQVHGDNTGSIAQGNGAKAKVCSASVIDKQFLEDQVLHEETFTNDERIKFLLFLKDKVR